MPSFQKIIDILSNAFSILDFSYIISGGFTLGIILFDLHYHKYEFFIHNVLVTIICGVFLVYICGLASWVIGKFIREIFQSIDTDFEHTFDEAVRSLGDEFSLPVSNKNLAYSYMWIELYKKEEAKERVTFINRMWVMQAVFEGLIFSFVTAMVVWLELAYSLWREVLCYKVVITLFVLLLLTCLSAIEARRYARNQVKEVILSYYSYCC